MPSRKPDLKKSDLITIVHLDGRSRRYIIVDVADASDSEYIARYEVLADPEEE